MKSFDYAVCFSCWRCHHMFTVIASLMLVVLCSVTTTGSAVYRQQFTIPEEQHYGTVVGRIGPSDTTTSDQNSHLPRPPYFIYFRSGNSDPAARHFLISADNGTIAILSPIDRENMPLTSSVIGTTDFRFEFVAESRDGRTIAVVVYIVDVNDNVPIFPVPVVRLTIPESASPETARFALPRAMDQDAGTNAVQRYRLISGNDDRKFKLIASTSGGQEVPASGARLELGLESSLDFEMHKGYRLIVEAVDGGQPTPKTGQLEVLVEVLDVNDNSPQFDADRFVASIAEDASMGTKVVRITATDSDSGDNGRVRYRIERVRFASADGTMMTVADGRNRSDNSNGDMMMSTTVGSVQPQPLNQQIIELMIPFEIDSTTGWLSTRQKLDYETTFSYELIVVAEDGGHRSLQTSAIVFIQVLDTNDNAPSIEVLFLSDDRSSSTSSGPRLSKSRSKPGDVVARVSVTDRDSDSIRQVSVVLECRQPVSSGCKDSFILVPQIGRGAPGNDGEADVDEAGIDYLLVVGVGELTSPWYRFDVIATDVGLLSDSRLIDIFVDDNDDDLEDASWSTSPATTFSSFHFEHSSYSAHIDPSRTVSGQVVARVRLLADTTVLSPPVVSYALAGLSYVDSRLEDGDDRLLGTGDRGLFRIGRRSGVVRTSGRISCGALPSVVKLVILVVEDANDTVLPTRLVSEDVLVELVRRDGRRRSAAVGLNIYVTESPGRTDSESRDVIGRVKFDRDFYEISVAENTAVGQCLLTVSMVGDTCSLPEVRYSLEPFGSNRTVGLLFDLISTGLPGYRNLCLTAPLDFEQYRFHEIKLMASATSGALLASAIVKVTVNDVNDNVPVFDKSEYYTKLVAPTSLRKASPTSAWIEIGIVRATDADNGLCGRVFYTIIGGNDDGLFSINQRSGILSALSDAFWDPYIREYQLDIVAFDGCSKYARTVDGNVTSSTTRVVVGITGSTRSLTSSSADVPRLEKFFYRFNVSASAHSGHVIGSIAVDDLPPDWQVLRYGIGGNGSTALHVPLNIDKTTGLITTTTAFDRKYASFTIFTVFAEFATVKQEQTTNLLVIAQALLETYPTDDKVPHFNVDNIRLTIREDSPVETAIYAASAFHLDHPLSSATIVYSILSSTNQDDDLGQFFDVDRLSGRVKLRRRLDREIRSIHRFSVFATLADGRLTSVDTVNAAAARLDVEVIVDDANDNSPKFEHASYACRLPPPGSLSATSVKSKDAEDDVERCVVHATDDDEELAARLSYHFDVNIDDSDDDRGLFEINSETGEVHWAASAVFDTVRCPPSGYRLRIAAVDGGFPTQRSASAGVTVVMTTADGPCRPRLPGDAHGTLRLTVDENSPAYTRIGSAVATSDSGSLTGKYFGMRYSADFRSNSPNEQGNADDKFGVDPETGEVFTKVVLDREQRSRYEFRIVAVIGSDSLASAYYGSVNISTDVIVDVTDSNDNCPAFVGEQDGDCHGEITVFDNQPSGSLVATVLAVDPDVGDNGNVVYSLINDSDTERCRGAFDIDARSGRITTTKTWHVTTLSRAVPYCTLKVSASDHGRSPCRTVRLMTVNFVDFDAQDYLEYTNPPLDSGLLSVAMFNFSFTIDGSRTPPGTILGHLNTSELIDHVQQRIDTDPFQTSSASVKSLNSINASNDEHGRSTELIFRITRGNLFETFAIDPDTGFLYVTRPINHIRCSTYRLIVEAISYDDRSDVAADDFRDVTFARLDVAIRLTWSTVDASGSSATPELQTTDAVSIAVREDVPLRAVVYVASTMFQNVSPPLRSPSPLLYRIDSQYCSTTPRDGTTVADSECAVIKVEPETGHVILISELNAEDGLNRITAVIGITHNHRTYVVDGKAGVFSAEGNNSTSMTLVTLIIDVIDVNDNAPIFDGNDSRSVFVDQDTPVGFVIAQLSASDDDVSADNSRVTYHIVDGNKDGKFRLDSESGLLAVANKLNFESSVPHRLTVIARDGGCPALEVTSTIVVHARDVNNDPPHNDPPNNDPPRFEQKRYEFFLSEDVAAGTVVGHLVAMDTDDNMKGMNRTFHERIQFKMASGMEAAEVFTLNQSSGALTTMTSLDREKKEKYVLTALITDGLHLATADVIVNVGDVNDNAPTFNQETYAIDMADVLNVIDVDQVLLTLSADDPDSGLNGILTYWISGGNSDGLFFIDPRTGSLSVGYQQRQQWSARQWRHSNDGVTPSFVTGLEVTATDHGQPSKSSTVHVEIRHLLETDRRNKPRAKFQTETIVDIGEPVRYAASVAEDCAIGKSILTVRYVEDRAVNVDDSVLEQPESSFSNGSRWTTPTDVVYSLALDADVEGRFSVDRKTGVINITRQLDYEIRSVYRFFVIVSRDIRKVPPTVQFLESVEVEINVTDIDECRAEFEQPVYRVTMPIDSPVGRQVLTVRAVDSVCGRPIVFGLLDKLTFISVNSSTGSIVIRRRFTGTAREHVFRLSADGRTTGAVLFIQLESSQSSWQRLQFSSNDYRVTIDENRAAAGTRLLTLSARFTSDGGISTVVGIIVYQFAVGNDDQCFSIDSRSGEMVLSNTSCIGFSAIPRRRLVVLAVSQDSIGIASVEINLRRSQVDDGEVPSAHFPTNLVEALVREEAPRGTTVVLLRAWNSRPTTCDGIKYELISGNLRNEFVLQSTGDGGAALRTNRKLDREVRAEYRLEVQAVVIGERCVDTPIPNKHSAVATIIVSVTDINDNSPFFPAFKQPITVREDIRPGSPFIQLTATDVDLNTLFSYSIIGGNINNVFSVDRRTGQMYVSRRLDTGTVSSYRLSIQASDGEHVTSVDITINVDDVNNNRPVFQRNFFRTSVRESVEAGSLLLSVSATDDDCRQEPCVIYSLEPADSGFEINSQNGSIYLTRALTYNASRPYQLLTVKATDTEDRDHVTLTSSVDILIDVQPIAELKHVYRLFRNGLDDDPFSPSTCRPGDRAAGDSAEERKHGDVIRRYQEYFTVAAEDTQPGVVLLSLRQLMRNNDSDVIDGRQRRFDIVSGNGDGLFAVNHVTGSLAVRFGLNYEQNKRHRLIVRTTPAGGSTDKDGGLTAVVIDVEDVNEFRPRFPLPLYRCTIDLNHLTSEIGGALVLSVHANDQDGGQYGVVEYQLESVGRDIDFVRFSIDRDTGDVRAIALPSAWTDVLPGMTFNFVVTASDAGGWTDRAEVKVMVARRVPSLAFALSTSATLSRRFALDPYEFRVPGNARSGSVVGIITLVDGRGRPVGFHVDDIMFDVISRNSSLFDVEASSGTVVVMVDLLSVGELGVEGAADVGRRQRRQSDKDDIDEVTRLDIVARPAEDLSADAAANRSSNRHHLRRWNAKTVVIIRIDRSCLHCSLRTSSTLVPHPSPRNEIFADDQLIIIAVVSSVFIVFSAIVIASIVVCRRRHNCSNKPTSGREGLDIVVIRTGVSMISSVPDSISRRKPASLPIPPPPSYPPTELVPLTRLCDSSDLFPLTSSREKRREKFDRSIGSVRGKFVTASSASSSTSADETDDETADTRFEDYFYDGASDSGLVDEDDFPSTVGSSLDAAPDLCDDSSRPQTHVTGVGKRHRSSTKEERRKSDVRSSTSGRFEASRRQSNLSASPERVDSDGTEDDEENSREVEPIYATVVGDVEESIANCFRFIAASGRTDLFAIADHRPAYRQCESVFSEIAQLPDGNGNGNGNGNGFSTASASTSLAHQTRKSNNSTSTRTSTELNTDLTNGRCRNVWNDPTTTRYSFNGDGERRDRQAWRPSSSDSPPVLTDSVVGPAGRLRRPLPLAAWQRVAAADVSRPTLHEASTNDEVGLESTRSDVSDDALVRKQSQTGDARRGQTSSSVRTSRNLSYC